MFTLAVEGGLAGVLVTAAGPLAGQQVGAQLLHAVADGAARPQPAGLSTLPVIRHIRGAQPAAVGLLPDRRAEVTGCVSTRHTACSGSLPRLGSVQSSAVQFSSVQSSRDLLRPGRCSSFMFGKFFSVNNSIVAEVRTKLSFAVKIRHLCCLCGTMRKIQFGTCPN